MAPQHVLSVLLALPLASTSAGFSPCDLALNSLCSDSRGGGSACTQCLSSFVHVAIIHAAGCSSEQLVGFCEPGINPLYDETVEAYHVYPRSSVASKIRADITSKNTADLEGMIYFVLRLLGNPVECAEPNIPGANISDPTVAFDCLNQETTGPLLMSVLSVQVDNRWGDYSFCNLCSNGYDPYGHGPNSRVPRRCSTGEYVCDCSSRIGNSCNGTVGQLDVSSFFGGFQPDIAGRPAPDWKWWQYNTGE